MSFKKLTTVSTTSFNSATSCDFLFDYEKFVSDKLRSEKSVVRGKTFAPSSLRCNRLQWFKLRGTEPDSITVPDTSLSFIADIGTMCHRNLQSNLMEFLGDNWIEVENYLKKVDIGREYKLEKEEGNPETLVTFYDPPIRFACDGIVIYNGITYLLEIKTSELSSWQTLTTAKLEHVDQVKAYSALLKLPNVLMIYQERQYGGLKCFELKVPQSAWDDTFHRFSTVMDCVKTNIAPEGLPVGDKWCTPSYCPYYNKCKEYGR
jgi:hypothetical protein